MKRRDFVKLAAFGAVTLVGEQAFGKKKQKKKGETKKGAKPAGGHEGTPNPNLRKRLEEKNPTTPDYEPPATPLELPPWRYGKTSAATDTVIMFRGNPAHTFYGTGPIPERPRMLWSHRMEDFHSELRGKPVTWSGTGWTGTAIKYGNYVFVGSVGRNFYAFEALTGKVAWRYRGGRMFKSSPCLYENRIYVGNVDDWLRCFDAATGQVIWKHHTGNDCDSSPVVVDGRLYLSGEAGFAWCLDPADGKVIWKVSVGGTGPGTLGGSNGSETSPAIVDGELYGANYLGELYSLNTADGSSRWTAQTGDDTDASCVIAGDHVYACAEELASRLYCFARADGREIWRYEGNRAGYWSTPAVVGDRVYVGGADTKLHCVDARTGQAIWTFKTGASVWSSPCVVDDKVIFGSMDAHLYCLDARTGQEIWRQKADGRFLSSPCIVDGHIWIGTATGTFYCFGP